MCVCVCVWNFLTEFYLILTTKSRNELELRKVRIQISENAGIIGLKAKICKWLLCL